MLPPFKGPVIEWDLPIELSFNVAAADQPFPENALAAAVRGAMPGFKNGHVSVSGIMAPETLCVAFPGQTPEGVMGVSEQHYEGPGVVRAQEAYGHVANLTQLVNRHTATQREPRSRDDISAGAYAGLLDICNEISELDWRLQSDLVDAAFVCRRAAEIHALTELVNTTN